MIWVAMVATWILGAVAMTWQHVKLYQARLSVRALDESVHQAGRRIEALNKASVDSMQVGTAVESVESLARPDDYPWDVYTMGEVWRMPQEDRVHMFTRLPRGVLIAFRDSAKIAAHSRSDI